MWRSEAGCRDGWRMTGSASSDGEQKVSGRPLRGGGS